MNPMHKYEGKWYFWDETWSDRLGPFNSEKVAKRYIYYYSRELNRKSSMPKYENDAPKEICPICDGKGKVKNLMRTEKSRGWIKKPRWIICITCMGIGLVDWITFILKQKGEAR